jgi:SAM-dependent methyltransferase
MIETDDITYLYFGNLYPHEPQYSSGLFRGLALVAKFDRDIQFDARSPLPFPDASIAGFQSQDVFEHIEYEKLSRIFDDIFRCLSPGGIFRLSLPDYNGPMLRRRSVFDSHGRILCDLAMGGAVTCAVNEDIKVRFSNGGDSHIWFPTWSNLLHLVISSQLRKCDEITLQHGWLNEHDSVCRPFDGSIMPVLRAPPRDMRADGKPISLIVDFVK